MIRGLGTLVVMIAFVGLILWVFSPRRKAEFDDATMLPFADEPPPGAEPERKTQDSGSDRP
jgi:cytochrome c oxidase cbb3-type subunit 4